MNPLSALPSLTAQSGQAISPLDPKLTSAAAKNIAPADLENISPTIPLLPAPPVRPDSVSGPAAPFESLLRNFVQGVNEKQAASSQAVQGLLVGQNVSLHQAMIAMEEASVSFQLMVEVRNKLLDSYQELMRMQI